METDESLASRSIIMRADRIDSARGALQPRRECNTPPRTIEAQDIANRRTSERQTEQGPVGRERPTLLDRRREAFGREMLIVEARVYTVHSNGPAQ